MDGGGAGWGSASRPVTAPARSRRAPKRRFAAGTAVGEEEDNDTSVKPRAAEIGHGRLPPGNARLLKSDRLNSDPQV